MVFMVVEGAKVFGQRRRQLVKDIHAQLSAMAMLALRCVPGGYMCRMQVSTGWLYLLIGLLYCGCTALHRCHIALPAAAVAAASATAGHSTRPLGVVDWRVAASQQSWCATIKQGALHTAAAAAAAAATHRRVT
jgi:hypothetical protein